MMILTMKVTYRQEPEPERDRDRANYAETDYSNSSEDESKEPPFKNMHLMKNLVPHNSTINLNQYFE